MIVRVSCPFCNTAFDLGVVGANHRVSCPRCGESFPVKGDTAIPHPSENGSAPATAVVHPVSPAKAFRSVAILGAVAAVVVLSAGLYAIFRPSEKPTPAESARKPAATMPPAAVASLAYLPAETTVAFAVQPGPILTYAERAKTDPKELLLQMGVPPRVFTLLEQAGIKLDQIDHVAGGVVIASDNPIPRMVFVLSFLAPLADEDAFLKSTKSQKFTTSNGSTRWKADLGGLPTELVRIGDRTYAFALDGKDIDKASSAASKGSGHLPLGLRQSMEKLSPASVVWIATDSSRWDDKPAVKLAAGLLNQPDLPARLANIRAAALGISLEPDPKLLVAVRSPDEASAKKLAENVAIKLGPKPVTVVGDWVSVESPFDPKQGLSAGVQALLPKK